MTACYVYGKRIADDHLWATNVRLTLPRRHSQGPLCLRCGLPLGTVQWETAADAHRERTGHGLDTGACEDTCYAPLFQQPYYARRRRPQWWDVEPILTRC